MSADLIARLKAATGPDRQLDNAIAEWAGFQVPDASSEGWPLAYTASIDAAMTLLSDDWFWEIRQTVRRDRVFVALFAVSGNGAVYAGGPSVAVAICLARLRQAEREGAR
jgi:hypothetical protein